MTASRGPARENSTKRNQFAALAAAAALAAFALGCGNSSPYPLVQVSGTVTYEDGSLIPAEAITLKFEPQAAPLNSKTFPRKSYGRVNVEDGTITDVTTHKFNDGIVAGKHKVLVIATTAAGQTTKLAPEEYRNPATTPIEVDTDNQPFDIKVRKPK